MIDDDENEDSQTDDGTTYTPLLRQKELTVCVHKKEERTRFTLNHLQLIINITQPSLNNP